MVGLAGQTSELDPRRLRILQEFVNHQPGNHGNKVGVLVNPMREHNQYQYATLELEAGNRLHLKKHVAIDDRGIKNAYKSFRKKQVLGVVVTANSFFNNRRDKIIAAAAPPPPPGVPTIYQWKVFVTDGGLISYGPRIEDAYRTAGELVGKVAQGTPPGNIKCPSLDPNDQNSF